MRETNVLSVILNIIFIPFVLIGKIFALLYKGIRKVLIDMFKHAYSRVIAFLVTIVVLWIVTSFFR